MSEQAGADSPGGRPLEARRLHVRGVVQGVGFRPFVRRLADRYGLTGSVRNDSGEVFIEVEGYPAALSAFQIALRDEAPRLARIDTVEAESTVPRGARGFRVLASRSTTEGRLPVSPDVAVCDPCRSELLSPADRRYRYPFITCTDCGPRYTVIESMPYDRERTSMRPFRQCEACEAEYVDPSDRRYHSETNSCPTCGPRVWLSAADGSESAEGFSAIEAAADLLRAGRIVAVRGLGGYHLAADATNEMAVSRLRERKARETKPLAIMVGSLGDAEVLAFVGPEEAVLLSSLERPIVLLRARRAAGLAPALSPGLDTVGVMLAYTPLHVLLLDLASRPLVMTSGNVSELPICTSNEEAREKLGRIADAFLMHDREIVSRYDDSVVRAMRHHAVFLRRARGYAPLPVRLPVPAPAPLLAVGPHLKNTFAVVDRDTAFVSQHIGDLENVETLDHFHAVLGRYQRLFRIRPTKVVRDLHPGYLSTRVAEDLAGSRSIPVQHHHAHIAAVAGEHGMTGPIVGIAYDGTGYGDDGHVWGAEVLVADLVSYRRRARLRYVPLPGGDLAVRRPWRVALGYLSLGDAKGDDAGRAFEGVPDEERRLAEAQISRGVNAPLASSMGRLFDAAAAILGVRGVASYEGQAAMELEALAATWLHDSAIEELDERGGVPRLPFPAETDENGTWVLDPLPLLGELARQIVSGAPPGRLAAAFHLAVARATVEVTRRICEQEGLRTVGLGGGVFQNAILLPATERLLAMEGLEVLVPTVLSPNDSAISYGQAVVAAARLAAGGG